MKNDNGVELNQTPGDHARAVNATCGCGCCLFVAPPILHPEHEKGNPIMVCDDHFIHAYWFKDLVIGRQPKTQRTRDFE